MNQMEKKEDTYKFENDVKKHSGDTYKEVRTFTYPNMVVRVHIPDLTEDERNRRMRTVKKAAEDLLKATIREERKAHEKLG